MFQKGASEIYLDGRRIFRFGRVAGPDSTERQYWERNPRLLTFRKTGRHLLAVRYSNSETEWAQRYTESAGFQLTLRKDLTLQIDNRVQVVRVLSLYQLIFFMIPLSLTVPSTSEVIS